MALDDIKKAVLSEAEKEASKIIKEGEKQVVEIKNEWAKKTEIKKQEIINSASRRADQKAQQARFKIGSQIQSQILIVKQEAISGVYSRASAQLADLDDNAYFALMSKLVNKLPEDQGELFSVAGRESLLKKALEGAKSKHQLSKDTVKGKGGFIFKSKDIEINNTFESLVDGAKDATSLAVSNLLFNRS